MEICCWLGQATKQATKTVSLSETISAFLFLLMRA
jgi:hypothetical protein